MKTKRVVNIALTGLILVLGQLVATGQTLQWVEQLSGSLTEEASGVVVDASGNILITGTFSGTTDFDPSTDVFNLTSAGFSDIFICKFSSSGAFLWAVRIGGTTTDGASKLAVDPAGNVYSTGFFQLSVDFDPGPGVYSLTGAGPDIFFLKLDPSGNFLWARKTGGGFGDAGYDVFFDNISNMIYFTGHFGGNIDFDPGPGTAYMASAGNADIFISVFDVNGNYVNSFRMGGTNFDSGRSIAVDATGNIYTTGHFTATSNFDPYGSFVLSSPGLSSDVFISKLDNSGNFIWAVNLGGTLVDEGHALTLDIFGNVYCTGQFNGTADFDPSPGVTNLVSAGGKDVFVVKLNASGGLTWVKQIGGTGLDGSSEVLTDASGNVYVSGYFAGSVNFDPAISNFTLNSFGNNDCFVTKLNFSAGHVWSIQLGGNDMDQVLGSTLDNNDNLVCAGRFQTVSDFDPGGGIYNLTSAGYFDIFIQTILNPGLPLPVELIYFNAERLDQYIVINWTTASEFNCASYLLQKSVNSEAWETLELINVNENSFLEKKYESVDYNPGYGSNYYRLKISDIDGNFNYSPVRYVYFSNQKKAITVYPNPATSHADIFYNAGLKPDQVRLFNIFGQQISVDVDFSNNPVRIHRNQLEAGSYFYQVFEQSILIDSGRLVFR